MASYNLKGIDKETWRRFKFVCAFKGVTIRDVFLACIESLSITDNDDDDLKSAWAHSGKKGGK